jgi:ABC-2 type transport system permease protein
MITDILTVARKELREIVVQGDPRGRSRFGLIILVLVFGIVIPLQNGRAWVETPVSLIVWSWMPFLWVSGIVADSFAGERERHTLEALLATRLSDRAILFGKTLAAMLYGFILTWIIMLLSLVVVNVSAGHGELLLFPVSLGAGAVIFSFLICGLAASLGVLVSLRAGSVRQAQQLMSAGMLVIFIPILLIQFLPRSLQVSVGNFLQQTDPLQAAVGLALVLLLVDATLILIGMRLFRRSKLILD